MVAFKQPSQTETQKIQAMLSPKTQGKLMNPKEKIGDKTTKVLPIRGQK